MNNKYKLCSYVDNDESESYEHIQNRMKKLKEQFPEKTFFIQEIDGAEKVIQECRSNAYGHVINKKFKNVDCYQFFEQTQLFVEEEYDAIDEMLDDYKIEFHLENLKVIMAVICYDLLSRLVNLENTEKYSMEERTWVPEDTEAK